MSEWRELRLLRGQFEGNCAALETRLVGAAAMLRGFVPRGEIWMQAMADRVVVARRMGGEQEILANRVLPAEAQAVAAKVWPEGKCTQPVLVAGVDQGWLWHILYQAPCQVAMMPGHRPPLFFLVRDLEALWVAMHLHDWRDLLADQRVRLFIGNDAAEKLQLALFADLQVPFPRISLTIDPQIWPEGTTFDTLVNGCRAMLGGEMRGLTGKLATMFDGVDSRALAERLGSGRKLRLLGITSRYTTFLQHSMRDWLAAFESLGHQTRLIIEQADHEVTTNLVFARECERFRPDLIVLIDHYRSEFDGLPQGVPCVMWIQDWLGNLTTPKAGTAQTARDYVLGYGRIECTQRYSYPRSRFMPAMVGVNEQRFTARSLSNEEKRRFGCDVSFVSHASTPAETLLKRELDTTTNPQARRLIEDIYERLRAIYDAGNAVSDPQHLGAVVDTALRELGLAVAEVDRDLLTNFFSHQINNALFRHQTLHWLAEMDVNFHLYGRGWELHPTLKRYARGAADNQTQLSAIYQASQINLHVTPHGAVHQRVLEGLCSGGFFLIRHRPGDAAGAAYRPLCQWVDEHGITSDEQLRAKACEQVKGWLAQACTARDWDVFKLGYPFVEELNLLRDSDYTLAGATLWDDYCDVAFGSRRELHEKVSHYLANRLEREAVRRRMVEPVLDKLTYRGITRRLLEFMAQHLRGQAKERAA